MGRLVMKFGGTSVADLACIRNVALHVEREVKAGHEVAVVVSAMAGTTDRLIELCRNAAPMHDAREYDAVIASGEQVTAGLLAIALQERGIPARSWQGWQVPIRTDGVHGAARISEIEAGEIRKRMDQGQVAVLTGFQGIGPDKRITTLGRGGSDTSAVALAAALEARCDIYTDVDGVYTSDPRIVEGARKIRRITYEEMLEMASSAPRCCRRARSSLLWCTRSRCRFARPSSRPIRMIRTAATGRVPERSCVTRTRPWNSKS
jgi:aspartate kinase